MAQQENFISFKPGHWSIASNVATKTRNSHGSAVGQKRVNSGVYQWVIQVEPTDSSDGSIGICNSSNSPKVIHTEPFKTPGTVSLYYTSRSGPYSAGYYNFSNCHHQIGDTLDAIKSGDQIKIILDFDHRKVTFYRNEMRLFVKEELPTENNEEYSLCVDGDRIGGKFTILASHKAAPPISLQPILTAMNVLTEQLNAFGIQELEKFTLTDLRKFKQITNKFENDCKEYEQTYEVLKETVRKFEIATEKQINPDTENFKQWDAEAICRYVLSLENGRFAKYMDVFKKELNEQQVTGADLPDTTSDELKSLGVKGLKDRRDLAEYFQALGYQ